MGPVLVAVIERWLLYRDVKRMLLYMSFEIQLVGFNNKVAHYRVTTILRFCCIVARLFGVLNVEYFPPTISR